MQFRSLISLAALNIVLGCRADSAGADDTSDPDGGSASDTGSVAHTVWAEAEGGGAISPEGELRVDAGRTVTFELTPDDGYALSSVSETCGGHLEELQFTTAPIEEDCAVVALFEEEVTEPAAYCSGIPPEQLDIVVCDPELNLDDWSVGRSYWTTELRIQSGTVLALPFTSSAPGREGIVEITNNMPGLSASGLFWHGWFSELPGGDLVEDSSDCRAYHSNPNPLQLKWNQTEPGGWACHLGTTERTLYFNMEVRCFEELSSNCTPGERYPDDYWLGVLAVPTE